MLTIKVGADCEVTPEIVSGVRLDAGAMNWNPTVDAGFVPNLLVAAEFAVIDDA